MSSRREKLTNDAYPFTPNTDLTETEPQYNQTAIQPKQSDYPMGYPLRRRVYPVWYSVFAGDFEWRRTRGPELTAEGKRVETGHGDSCTWRMVCL